MNVISELSGNQIRALRQSRKVSQAKLALLLGVRQSQLSQWELGKILPPPRIADRILAVLGQLRDDEIEQLRKKRYRRHHYLPKDSLATAPATHGQEAVQANREYLSLLDGLETSREPGPGSQERPSAIALFSGCGGMSLGFSWAGFDVRGFVEVQSDFRRTYRANFPNAVQLGTDITALADLDLYQWQQRLGNIQVLFGGPPCQGFSLTGKRDRLDPRNELFRHLARVAKILQPVAIVLENVRLLTSMKSASGSLVKDEVSDAFEKIGYRVSHEELDAQDYGVPQHRERVFFIGLRKDTNLIPSFPEPTHGLTEQAELFASSRAPYRTFRVATCDLEPLESGQHSQTDIWHEAVAHPGHIIEWLRGVPEGGSAHDNPEPHLRPPSGYNTTYKRLCWDEPASTVSTTFGMISGCRNVHPLHTRSLTVREALRCQSFPDAFQLVGSLGSIRTSIGNAVPPLLALALARHLKERVFRRPD